MIVLNNLQSYKFSDRIQLDAIVHNELGSAAEIAELTPGGESVSQRVPGYRGSMESVPEAKLPFQVINLRYDLTPAGLISMVVTETGLIPPSSIPVLLRELKTDAK